MTKRVESLVAFPVNAQRNSFLGALSSILLYRNGCTEDTPFFCGKRQSNCIRCGGCGNEPFLHKHHLQIYQYLITITGCAYFWMDKEIGSSFNRQYLADEFSETALDRLSLALYASCYHYESMDKSTEADVLFDRIRRSTEEKRPILNKRLLLEASDLHLHFHDQAWKIWELLGVGPQTHYCVPHNVNESLDKAPVRAELKVLFQELFAIDRQVCHLLHECLHLL